MEEQLGVVYQNRFTPAAQATKRAIEAGRFGRLVLGSASVKWYRSQAYYDAGGWRGTWTMDGGALMNQSIHALDLLEWFMGPVESVQAYTATRGHAMEAEDVAVAALRFQKGALGMVEGTTCAYPGLTVRLEVHGTHGTALIQDGRQRLLCFRKPDEDIGMFGLRPLNWTGRQQRRPHPWMRTTRHSSPISCRPSARIGRQPWMAPRDADPSRWCSPSARRRGEAIQWWCLLWGEAASWPRTTRRGSNISCRQGNGGTRPAAIAGSVGGWKSLQTRCAVSER